ncbi:hypothetical protein E2P81_ATG08933 [Venturia nashicola]|nr:hypothetical protein E2P81_ATG08933 [Venturia nashicola]
METRLTRLPQSALPSLVSRSQRARLVLCDQKPSGRFPAWGRKPDREDTVTLSTGADSFYDVKGSPDLSHLDLLCTMETTQHDSGPRRAMPKMAFDYAQYIPRSCTVVLTQDGHLDSESRPAALLEAA